MSRERYQSAGSENEANVKLRPMMRGQIDRDKWTEAGLDIGKEKSEPIKAASAGACSRAGRCRRRLARRRQRSLAAVTAKRAVKLQCDRRQLTISGTAGDYGVGFRPMPRCISLPSLTVPRAQPGRLRMKDDLYPRAQYAQRGRF